MQVTQENRDGKNILKVDGRIDSNTAQEFEENILSYIKAPNPILIIDFSAIQFISSAGLRALLLAAKKIKPLEGKIILCALPKDVYEVFKISGFIPLFHIEENIQSALKA